MLIAQCQTPSKWWSLNWSSASNMVVDMSHLLVPTLSLLYDSMACLDLGGTIESCAEKEGDGRTRGVEELKERE